MTDLVVTVAGDAVGGWIVSTHDGDRMRVYSPIAANADEAERKAREMLARDVAATVDAAPVLPEPTPLPAPTAFISAERAADQAASVSVNVMGVAR